MWVVISCLIPELTELCVFIIWCIESLRLLTLASSAEWLCSSSRQRAFARCRFVSQVRSFSLISAIWQVQLSKSSACFLEIVSCSKKLFSHSFEMCFKLSNLSSVSLSLAFVLLFSNPNLWNRPMKAWICEKRMSDSRASSESHSNFGSASHLSSAKSSLIFGRSRLACISASSWRFS